MRNTLNGTFLSSVLVNDVGISTARWVRVPMFSSPGHLTLDLLLAGMDMDVPIALPLFPDIESTDPIEYSLSEIRTSPRLVCTPTRTISPALNPSDATPVSGKEPEPVPFQH